MLAGGPLAEVREIPITLAGLARHNVANALAAAGGARALGASIEQVRDGLLDFRPVSEELPGRLNIFRNGARVAIVDFAHNEAGLSVLLDVAEGIAAGAGGRVPPVTVIIGTAGDRPDDTLRGIGRIAAAGPSDRDQGDDRLPPRPIAGRSWVSSGPALRARAVWTTSPFTSRRRPPSGRSSTARPRAPGRAPRCRPGRGPPLTRTARGLEAPRLTSASALDSVADLLEPAPRLEDRPRR